VPDHRYLGRTARSIAVVSLTVVVVACAGAFAPRIAQQPPDARPPAAATASATAPPAAPATAARPTALPRATVAATPTATSQIATAVPVAAPTPAPTPEPLPEATPIRGEGGRPTGPVESAIVTSVTDGDTVRVALDGGTEQPLRYIGIDTPESVDPGRPVGCYGTEAAAANAALVAGQTVVLERDVSDSDQYGRLLRHVWLELGSGWLLVNLELVRLGYAAVSTYPPDVKYNEQLLAAQQEAIAAGAGLWGPAACSSAPPAPAADGGPPAAEAPPPAGQGCDPSYPDVCIPRAPPDLDCGDVPARWFTVLPSDPHRFDGNGDGVGCDSD
jgi:micrococcal nuclease